MPVREALRRLAAEGALEIRSSGSAHVPDVARSRLDDICRARIALEQMATEMAAERMTEAQIDRLDRITMEHAEVANLQDIHDMLLKNRDFHFGLYRASGSEVLPPLIESLWLQYGPYMRMLSNRIAPEFDRGRHKPFMDGHRAIVDALHARDARSAGLEIAGDIRRTQLLLQKELEASQGENPASVFRADGLAGHRGNPGAVRGMWFWVLPGSAPAH